MKTRSYFRYALRPARVHSRRLLSFFPLPVPLRARADLTEPWTRAFRAILRYSSPKTAIPCPWSRARRFASRTIILFLSLLFSTSLVSRKVSESARGFRTAAAKRKSAIARCRRVCYKTLREDPRVLQYSHSVDGTSGLATGQRYSSRLLAG